MLKTSQITKPIAHLIKETMLWDSKNFVKSKLHLKLQKVRVEAKRNTSGSLKTNFLLIGLH